MESVEGAIRPATDSSVPIVIMVRHWWLWLWVVGSGLCVGGLWVVVGGGWWVVDCDSEGASVVWWSVWGNCDSILHSLPQHRDSPMEQSSVIHQIPPNWPLTQYLWYERNVTILSPPSPTASLDVMSAYANALLLFVDSVLAGLFLSLSLSDICNA